MVFPVIDRCWCNAILGLVEYGQYGLLTEDGHRGEECYRLIPNATVDFSGYSCTQECSFKETAAKST